MFYLILFVVPLVLASFEEPPTVHVSNGLIEGFEDATLTGRRINSFMGIPFAKAPVGELRFENPVEAEPWSGTLLAKKMPKMCLQIDMHAMILKNDYSQSGSEDCLYLNVFTPNVSLTANFAVMVFIHGGGYFNGAADDYHPYVLLDENIVLVVIQYRLGIFGFLSTGDDVLPGNLGLKDQTFALKWVQENIAHFGGDSNRVTIFGQSAGGASVQFHMLSPMSKGLFHRAIMHSGSCLVPWSTVHTQRELAEQIANLTNCPIQSAHYKKCLQKIDSSVLLDGATASYKWGVAPLFASPRVDGEFLEEEPMTLMVKKKYNKVNVITGVTKDDGAFFSALILKSSVLMDNLRKKFDENGAYSLFLDEGENGRSLANKAYYFYLGDKQIDLLVAEEITQMLSHQMFMVAHDLSSMFFAKDEDVDVYRYELVYRGKQSLVDSFDFEFGKNWVTHGDDLLYLFHGGNMLHKFPITNDVDLQLRKVFVKLWVQFAMTGNPTPSDSLGFTWSPATASNFVHLALQPEPEIQKDSREEIRKFWFSLPTEQNKLNSFDQNPFFTSHDENIKKIEL